MDIVFVTTSHRQVTQVEMLLSSLADFVKISTTLKVHCIVTESFLGTRTYDQLVALYADVFQSFTILPVTSNNY